MRKDTKTVQRVMLAEGYFDTADCRRKILVFDRPLDDDSSRIERVSSLVQAMLTGKRVRLVAEILP